MKNVSTFVMTLIVSTMMVGCVEAIPVIAALNKGDSGSVTAPDGGGKGDETDKTPEQPSGPKLFTGNPSDEFEAATFDSSRWTVAYLNNTTTVAKSAQGLKLGDNNQAQVGPVLYEAQTKYTTQINDIYGDSIVAEFNFRMLNAERNKTQVVVEFENGKKMEASIVGINSMAGVDYYGSVRVFDTDKTTVIYDTTGSPIHLASASQCMEFKIVPNYNGTSTAQWNVDFVANCAATGYATYTALDHATLGGTDYVGTGNGKARYTLVGQRDEYDNLDSYYVELLNWNFSVLGAKIYAE